MRFVKPSEEGSAIVEFITFGVVALLLLSTLLSGVFLLQRAAFTTQSAAREAARAFVQASTDSEAYQSAKVAARVLFADANMAAPSLRIECSDRPCLSPNGRVTIWLSHPVKLILGTWTVRAKHEEPVSPWL